MIISFILMTLMFDSVVILWGEIKCWSLLGVKGFISNHLVQEALAWKTKLIFSGFFSTFD